MVGVGAEDGRAGQWEELLSPGPQAVHRQGFLVGSVLPGEEDLVFLHGDGLADPPLLHPHHQGAGGGAHEGGDPFEEETFDGFLKVLGRVIEQGEPDPGTKGNVQHAPVRGSHTHHLKVPHMVHGK